MFHKFFLNIKKVDLALSFQDNAGCLDIPSKITNVQSKAGDLFRSKGCFPVVREQVLSQFAVSNPAVDNIKNIQ